MAETTQTHDATLIKIEVPAGADAHETVAPHVQRYAESPNDFDLATQTALATHIARCQECRKVFDANSVGGDE